MKKQLVRTLSRTVDNIVLLALLVCLIFATWAFVDSRAVTEAASARKYETYKPTTEEGKKSFADLQAMNSDVMGWLTIYGTSIDYPIVKAQTNNWEYLSKNAEGEWESSGALFVDYRSNSHFEDFNTIIHGHHMANHVMFGDLDLFTDRAYFNEHQYANLFFDGTNHGLEIFAVMTIDAYHPVASTVNAQGDARQELLNRIWSEAKNTRNISVTPDDHIIVMTTCNLGETNGRYTLVAKLLDHEVANPFPEEEEAVRLGDRLDVFSWLSSFKNLPIWLWIVILLSLIILTWLLYKLELRRLARKKKKKLEKEKRLADEQPNQQPPSESNETNA